MNQFQEPEHVTMLRNTLRQFIEKEMPIHISNLAFFDLTLKKGVRVGFKFDQKNKKIIINKNSGKTI